MSKGVSGLGRGLEALIPQARTGGIREIPLSQIRPSTLQPRQKFDPESLAELADSIRAQGVVQPILVRPAGNGYQVVAGERRLRAAKMAGLTTIPAVVRELSDQKTLELAIVENLQRQDLNPLEEAQALEGLQGYGLSQTEVAKLTGRSRPAIANALRLLELPDDAKAALVDGKISSGHARAILALPEERRRWALGQILRRGLSVRRAEQLAKDPPVQRQRRPYRHLEERLGRRLGTTVHISGARRGRLEITYRSAEELRGLLAALGEEM